jgi:alpha-D-xyloside xylohydrolase
MKNPVDWQKFVAELDFSEYYEPPHSLRQWIDFRVTHTGVVFRCEASGWKVAASDSDVQQLEVYIDVIYPDVLRLRMNPDGLREKPEDMLVQQEWTSPPFEVIEGENVVTVITERLRAEFIRSPWQMKLFDCDSDLPFFEQQVRDRAYGPAYEVAPIGFDRNEDGTLSAREAVAVSPGESFYGFGEKFTPLDKWGQELTSWQVDSGNVSSPRSYKNIPFFMSTAGYGVFVNSSFPMVYRMGNESSISYSFHVMDQQLDYFIIRGPEFKHILKRYTDLTGCAPVPPKWSFGFWISRCGYKTRSEVEAVIQQMRERGFPCDVISLDPWWMGEGPWCSYEWDTDMFPEPSQMMQGLRDQGVRTCLWIHPYMPVGSEIYQEAEQAGFLIKKSDGSSSPVMEVFSGTDLAAVDFTNPAAQLWFQSKLERLLKMGAAVFKSDFGEQAPIDAVYHDGRSGVEMHNLYPLIYNRAVFELTEKYFGRGLTWGRAAYAGSQRYPVQWGGDSYSSLDQLACQVRGLLGYGMSGVPFCSHDVGGFDGSPDAFDKPEIQELLESKDINEYLNMISSYPVDPEVYIRWMQFGVFSSHVRAHGKQPHEPWEYGEEAEIITRRYLKLRYRLLPYIYSEAVRSSQDGLPMARPLVLEYQSDPNTHHLDLEYLFGRDILVAPVVTRASTRKVYLPEGNWVDFWSKENVPGGRWVQVQAPLEKLPLWVRAGAILPLGPEMDYVDQKPLEPLVLELYSPDGEYSTIVHDENCTDISVSYIREGKTLSVSVGAAPGQVQIALYGMKAESVVCDGGQLEIQSANSGQQIEIDGRRASQVIFELEHSYVN